MSKVIRTAFLFVALLFALSFVSALNVSGPFFVVSGQCETTMQKYSVCAQVPGTYFISASGIGSSWVSLAPTSLILSGSSCADVFAFITPDCYANSGTYAPRLIVSGVEDYNAPITIEINQAHTFSFDIAPLSVISAPCVENVLNATLKNTGKFKDEFVISQSSVPNGWIVSAGTKIVVDPYATANFQIKVTPACNAGAKKYDFSVNLSNTRTNASASKAIAVEVTKINPISASGLFDKQSSLDISLCSKASEVKHFDVNNLSAVNDTYDFYLLDSNFNPLPASVASFDKQSISIASGKSADLNLLIAKNPAGIIPLTFRAHSNAFDKNYDAQINIKIENCYALSILRESSDTNSCVAKSNQKFVLANGGTKAFDTNISLSKVFPQWVSFSEASVLLVPEQTKTIFVYFSPPAGTSGRISGLLTAKGDGNISKDINVSLNVLIGTCSAYGADGNLNGEVSGLKTISRKEVTIDFVLSNDSNSGYNVYDINAPDFNVAVDFNKGIFVDANNSLNAKITFRFAEGENPNDQNVLIAIKTSAGDLNKITFVKFSDASTQMPITGLFGAAGVMTVGGLLVILLIVLALLALVKANANSMKPRLKK